jgi:hypothetical protein
MENFGHYLAKNHATKLSPNKNTCYHTACNMVEHRVAAQQFDHSWVSLPCWSCFYHHHIIIMDIDDDVIDMIVNNQPG